MPAALKANLRLVGASDWRDSDGLKLWTPVRVLMASDDIVLFHDWVVVGNKTQCLCLPDLADAFWSVKRCKGCIPLLNIKQ